MCFVTFQGRIPALCSVDGELAVTSQAKANFLTHAFSQKIRTLEPDRRLPTLPRISAIRQSRRRGREKGRQRKNKSTTAPPPPANFWRGRGKLDNWLRRPVCREQLCRLCAPGVTHHSNFHRDGETLLRGAQSWEQLEGRERNKSHNALSSSLSNLRRVFGRDSGRLFCCLITPSLSFRHSFIKIIEGGLRILFLGEENVGSSGATPVSQAVLHLERILSTVLLLTLVASAGGAFPYVGGSKDPLFAFAFQKILIYVIYNLSSLAVQDKRARAK